MWFTKISLTVINHMRPNSSKGVLSGWLRFFSFIKDLLIHSFQRMKRKNFSPLKRMEFPATLRAVTENTYY